MFELAGKEIVRTEMKVINVMGASVDGFIAASPEESDADRERYGFTGPADRRHLDEVLAGADAVIVGGHSVNVSGGVIPAARAAGGFPTWIFLTNHGFAADAPIWRHPEVPKWLAGNGGGTAQASGASKIITEADDNLLAHRIREACRAAGFERVLLFGGGRVNRLFYQAGLVDELILTVCPVIVGQSTGVPIVAPGLDSPKLLKIASVRNEDDMVFIRYFVK